MQGGADSELIEFIESDPAVFGPSSRNTPPPTPRRRRPHPKWMLPAAATVGSIMLAAATLGLWQPWENQFRVPVAFPLAPVSEPTLTERLVFGTPPAELSASSIGDTSDSGSFEGGYLFAAPDASMNMGQGGVGRWAAFIATDADGSSELETGRTAADLTVQEVPGVLTPSLENQALQLSFGPLSGQMYSVVTSEVSRADTLAFAEVVSLDDGVPRIADISMLRGLRPLCSVGDVNNAQRIVLNAANPAYFPQPQIISSQYGAESDRFTVTSQRAPQAGLEPLRFVLGGKVDAMVHGEPALTFATNDSEALLAFGVKIGSVVAWLEGGRLIMVTGRLPIDELLQLAESVRPATDDEWAQVVRVAVQPSN